MSKRHRNNTIKSVVHHHVPGEQLPGMLLTFLECLNCPRALTVWLLYHHAEHDQLSGLECNPSDYNDDQKFRDSYTATEFLSKSSFLKTSFNREVVAYRKFNEFEELCGETNLRFKSLPSCPFYLGTNAGLLHATQRKIAQILGEFEPEEWVNSCNWGPGVSKNLKGSRVSAHNKFHLENGITRDLHALIEPWFSTAYPLWDQHLSSLRGNEKWQLHSGNSVCTVPKSSKTDRVIAVEPGMNLWFQKGVGEMIRKRLKRYSINLNSQERNQKLAKVGSLSNDLATIDFSSASDSVAKELVRELLPPRWFLVMDCCRSKFGIVAGKPVEWKKFSSMGNGFTFELESLIFFAAAKAVTEWMSVEGEVSVYGDDVIIPSSCYELYSSFCAFLGFRVNPKKSFFRGNFRESCGSHYFRGVDCKPFYLKKKVQNVQGLFKLANGIRLLAHRRCNQLMCDRSLLPAWRSVVSRIPSFARFRGPRSLGDSVLISNLDEAVPPRANDPKTPQFEGWKVRALVDVSQTDYLDSPAVLLTGLWVPSTEETSNSYSLRGRTKVRLTTCLVSQWCNLGGWV